VSARRLSAAVFAPAVLLGACASMPSQPGFDDVRRSVGERTGMRVHWSSGAPEDRAVADAIGELLTRPLSADEAVQLALLNSRELQAVYEELSIAQADLVQAGLLRNPVFGGEVRFGVNAAGTGVALDVTQDFLSILSMPLRKRLAESQLEAAKVRVTGAVVDKAAAVREAYYEYVAGAQVSEMRRTVLGAARASYELAKRVRAAGNTPELALSLERDDFEQAKLDLALAEEQELIARERLTGMMGLWGGQAAWRAEPRLPPIPALDPGGDVQAIERRAVEASLDLALARREIEVAARALGISRPFPWLDGAEVGAAADRELDGAWSVGPRLALPIPLLDQGQAASGRAGARLRQASAEYHARAVEVRSRARAAAIVLNSSRRRVMHYEAVVLPLRERIVQETQLQYNAMQVPAFQLFDAKRRQVDAGAGYVGALRDYWLARTRLEHILGGPLAAPEQPAAPAQSNGRDSAPPLSDPPDSRPGGRTHESPE